MSNPTDVHVQDEVLDAIKQHAHQNPPKSQFELMQARRKGTRKVFNRFGYRIVAAVYKGKTFILEATKNTP